MFISIRFLVLVRQEPFEPRNDVGLPNPPYAFAIALVRFSATLSRKPVVESQR